jgi:hypothetical protein
MGKHEKPQEKECPSCGHESHEEGRCYHCGIFWSGGDKPQCAALLLTEGGSHDNPVDPGSHPL